MQKLPHPHSVLGDTKLKFLERFKHQKAQLPLPTKKAAALRSPRLQTHLLTDLAVLV